MLPWPLFSKGAPTARSLKPSALRSGSTAREDPNLPKLDGEPLNTTSAWNLTSCKERKGNQSDCDRNERIVRKNNQNIHQTRQGASVHSSLSVVFHIHRGRYEDEVSVGVIIHVHGANSCPKIFSTLSVATKKMHLQRNATLLWQYSS